jgi:hypothetical protein
MSSEMESTSRYETLIIYYTSIEMNANEQHMKQQNKQMILCIRRILFINQPTLDAVAVLKRVKKITLA